MSLQSTLRSGRVYKKMERDQDDRPLDRVPEDPEEGDGNEEENGGEQHGGADGAGAMAQMLQLNRVPEDPEEGDGNEEEKQHGGAAWWSWCHGSDAAITHWGLQEARPGADSGASSSRGRASTSQRNA